MRLLLTGGGTAGHVFPLLSVLDELRHKLKDERIEALYVGHKGGIEETILKNKDIPSIFTYSGKWRRYWKKWPFALLLNFIDLFKIFIGFFQAFFIVVRFRPEVVMAKGGYVTLPVVFASLFCRVPVITHESDVVMGLSNKIGAKIAKRICVSFPLEFYKGIPKEKMVETGNPVRKEFFEIPEKKADEKFPTILITGGSQGSQNINQTIYQILPEILQIAEVIHITGSLGFSEATSKKRMLEKNLQTRYLVYEFLEKEWPDVIKGSDLIISRAGANTLSEIAAAGKPSILIPLPTAASDHQTKNAEIFQKKGAAVILNEKELSPLNLLTKVQNLIKNKNLQKDMAEKAKSLSQKAAASKIAEEIIKLRRT